MGPAGTTAPAPAGGGGGSCISVGGGWRETGTKKPVLQVQSNGLRGGVGGGGIKRHVANAKFTSNVTMPFPKAYLGKGGSCWRECLRLRAQRVRVLLGCVARWQDFRSWNIRTGSAAGGGVSVRVVTLLLHQRRRRSHCGGGGGGRRRSVPPHGVLIHGTAKRRRSVVHVGS